MDIAVLIQLIMEFIQMWIENKGRRKVEACLEKPGVIQKIAWWAFLRKRTDLQGAALAQEVHAGIDFLKSLGKPEVAQLCDEAEARK